MHAEQILRGVHGQGGDGVNGSVDKRNYLLYTTI